MVRTFAFLFICLLLCQAQQAPQATQAQQANIISGSAISGTLKGEDGTSVVAGSVFLTRTVPAAGRVRQTEWSMKSGTKGEFRFDGLPSGQYTLCAQVPASLWLNPCEWGLKPPVVSISSQRGSVDVTMVLKKGAVVPIRIDDPGRWLSQNEWKTKGAHLLVGVSNDNHVFLPASVTANDFTGRNYQLVIPFDAQARLVVSSAFFQLNDESGRQLARTAATSIPITVPTGQKPTTIRLTVTGGGR